MFFEQVKARHFMVLALAGVFLYTVASSFVRWTGRKIGETYATNHHNRALYPSVTFCPISDIKINQTSFHKNLKMYNYSKVSFVEEYVQRFDHPIELDNG